jgi:hypothetical protein
VEAIGQLHQDDPVTQLQRTQVVLFTQLFVRSPVMITIPTFFRSKVP